MSKKNWGEVGMKGTACLQSQTFYRTPFTHERGAIVQFDRLVARQSNSDIKNLTLVHKRHSGIQETKLIKNLALSVGAFEFYLQENFERSLGKR